jgi:hypothetical protein
MRQITMNACNALQCGTTFHGNNTVVDFNFNEKLEMRLFGNPIARYNDNGKIEICDGGHQSVTTKERLNGLNGVEVYQRNYQWFLNDEPWDGSWTVIS